MLAKVMPLAPKELVVRQPIDMIRHISGLRGLGFKLKAIFSYPWVGSRLKRDLLVGGYPVFGKMILSALKEILLEG